MADEKVPPSRRTGADLAHIAVKAALSAVPLVGGPAAEVFAAIFVAPVDRRRDKWMQEIASDLLELRQQGVIDLESLGQNERFVSAVLTASVAAIKTHREEKRKALRNAILNVAVGRSADENFEGVAMSLIDRFTPWHLRVLALWPPGGEAPGTSVRVALERQLPELRGHADVYDAIVRDLVSHELIQFRTGWEGTSLEINARTPFGNRFVDFISEPV